MKRDPKQKKKRLTFSADKVREVATLSQDQLANINGGWVPQPCGMTYRG